MSLICAVLWLFSAHIAKKILTLRQNTRSYNSNRGNNGQKDRNNRMD